MEATTVGVLALQGGFQEHMHMLERAAQCFPAATPARTPPSGVTITVAAAAAAAAAGRPAFAFLEVRNTEDLARCDALLIPGGESTTISIVAQACGLLEPLRDFVKAKRKPVWGTCAGLILLSAAAANAQKGGQELVGGLDVRVRRNAFGRQINSFVAELDLAFLDGLAGDAGAGGVGLGVAEAEAARGRPFKGVFIRAPVVESILPSGRAGRAEAVEVLAILPREEEGGGREPGQGDGDGGTGGRIVAVRQGRIFGTSFHPELTDDCRIHLWWLQQVWEAIQQDRQALESR